MVKKLVPDPFLKSENGAYLWINSLKFHTVCFSCMASWGLLNYIESKLQSTCFHLIKLFLKIERGLELVPLPHFPHNFWRKVSLLLCSVNWPNFIIIWLSLLWLLVPFHCLVVVTLLDIEQYVCIGIVYKPGCDVMYFEVNLSDQVRIFLIKLFILYDQNVVTKT